MIIWLASYPKSGNTFLRSLLTAYLFTKDGNFNFEVLKNINQFPNNLTFEKLGIDTSNQKEVIKNYIKVQEETNKRDGEGIRFLKTHSTLQDIDGHKFTNLKNCLGAIYIVRDPRDVAKSYSNHNSTPIDESINHMKEFNIGGGIKSKDRKNETITHIGSWSSHYTSWKEFDKVDRYLLIKYEDLVKETEKTFLKVLTFVCKLTKKKLDLDKNKLKNVLNTTSFESMQKLEKQNGFSEASDFNGKKVTFFKYGAKNNWKNFLTSENRKKIEDSFREEMKELGYL
ncbi:sulfotransferase domain-containing protein [Candidatus Pelagibacter ubique]|nr:sulfotransferase domain-containing protein [Candidatus Pelagibacter ubique]